MGGLGLERLESVKARLAGGGGGSRFDEVSCDGDRVVCCVGGERIGGVATLPVGLSCGFEERGGRSGRICDDDDAGGGGEEDEDEAAFSPEIDRKPVSLNLGTPWANTLPNPATFVVGRSVDDNDEEAEKDVVALDEVDELLLVDGKVFWFWGIAGALRSLVTVFLRVLPCSMDRSRAPRLLSLLDFIGVDEVPELIVDGVVVVAVNPANDDDDDGGGGGGGALIIPSSCCQDIVKRKKRSKNKIQYVGKYSIFQTTKTNREYFFQLILLFFLFLCLLFH
jgi:hypothetical protein